MSRKQRRAANRRSRTAIAVPAHGPERDLTEAVGHHQAGRLAAAERLYRKVLDQDPANADALHLLGVVCHQTGRDARAVELIGMALAAVLAGTGGTVLALQRNPEPGEIERFAGSMGRELHDLTALNDDLEDMLAVMDLIDEYVCVSNTNTHLRAARGKPSRVLVPHPADYRWMDSGDESPGFPGTPTYRESPQAGWDAALERLAADLAAAVPPGSERPGR